MERCVIFAGASICDYTRIKSYLKKDDFIIACDGGLNHLEQLGLKANLIVGDFDSYSKPETSCEIIQLPREKDDTDSFFACKEAVKRGFSDFLLLGFTGQRFDHSLVNISVLLYLKKNGKKALLLDDYSEMEILDRKTIANISDNFSYFSLLCIGGSAFGVTIKNAKFPLENGKITPEYQYAVSNEVIKGKKAEISLKKGTLLLVKIF